MHTPSTFSIPDQLRHQMARSLGPEGHDELAEEIDFWQDSMRGKYDNMSISDQVYAKRIHNWYETQIRSHGYQSRDFHIPASKMMILQKFREDPNYHLKNLVELILRSLLDQFYKLEGRSVKVLRTTDIDDLSGGADCIAMERDKKGKLVCTGFDFAVSNNPVYLQEKKERTSTVCNEFNAVQRANIVMNREVFAVPTLVMAKFLPECMEIVSGGGSIDTREIVDIFLRIKKEVEGGGNTQNMKHTVQKTTHTLRDETKNRTAALIH